MSLLLSLSMALGLLTLPARAQDAPPPPPVDSLHATYDTLLDLYVRDGFVYYRALESDRGRFDRYIASLDVSPAVYAKWTRDQQLAFWINAYNALVLRTIIDHYPIRGRAAAYPASSIRQIPGAFDTIAYRVGGERLTLDQIEQTKLPSFKEPRAFLALGRGAFGGGRLHSEAYTSARLEEQLQGVAKECLTLKECIVIDEASGTVGVSPVFSWREAQFVETLGATEMPEFPGRSPIERAVLALVRPNILPGERTFLRQNNFKLTFQPFDWRLNDLTGGMPAR